MTDALAFVLAKAELFVALGIKRDESRKVCGTVHGAEVAQCRHFFGKVRVALELCLEYFVGCAHVGLSRVGIFEVCLAVKSVGRAECALLFFVKDVLYIYTAALAKVKVASGPKEFFGEHRNVKLVAVVPSKVTSLKQGKQFG